MAQFARSSGKAKAIAKAWLDFRVLARTIRGQAAMLQSVKTNSALDVPHAWLEQIEELRLALENLRREVEARAEQIPEGAHPRVVRERNHILDSMEIEFRALYEDLFGGVQHIRALLNDPTRTATSFEGSFLDYLSAGAECLKLWLSKRKPKKPRR
jgi:hypothetical protein